MKRVEFGRQTAERSPSFISLWIYIVQNDIINDSIKQSSTASAKYYLICLSDLDHEKFLIKIIISFTKTQISDPLY